MSFDPICPQCCRVRPYHREALVGPYCECLPPVVTTANTTAPLPAYLTDDVTVGEIMRWLNAEVVNAARQPDLPRVEEIATRAGQLENVLMAYRSANPRP